MIQWRLTYTTRDGEPRVELYPTQFDALEVAALLERFGIIPDLQVRRVLVSDRDGTRTITELGSQP